MDRKDIDRDATLGSMLWGIVKAVLLVQLVWVAIAVGAVAVLWILFR